MALLTLISLFLVKSGLPADPALGLVSVSADPLQPPAAHPPRTRGLHPESVSLPLLMTSYLSAVVSPPGLTALTQVLWDRLVTSHAPRLRCELFKRNHRPRSFIKKLDLELLVL